jgi:hypothetical protein
LKSTISSTEEGWQHQRRDKRRPLTDEPRPTGVKITAPRPTGVKTTAPRPTGVKITAPLPTGVNNTARARRIILFALTTLAASQSFLATYLATAAMFFPHEVKTPLVD